MSTTLAIYNISILTCFRFTTRGIIAFVFSCITGVLGVCVVAWYGMSTPAKTHDNELAGQNGGDAQVHERVAQAAAAQAAAAQAAAAQTSTAETTGADVRSS